MASPVILKPMAFADGNVRPAVVILKAPAPEAIKIGERQLKLHPPDSDPVLEALEANDSLEALRKAARIQGFAVEVCL